MEGQGNDGVDSTLPGSPLALLHVLRVPLRTDGVVASGRLLRHHGHPVVQLVHRQTSLHASTSSRTTVFLGGGSVGGSGCSVSGFHDDPWGSDCETGGVASQSAVHPRHSPSGRRQRLVQNLDSVLNQKLF